jgi:hypothetical protein
MLNPADFVNLERYPLTTLDSAAGRDLVARIQKEMVENCVCALDGFLRPKHSSAW